MNPLLPPAIERDFQATTADAFAVLSERLDKTSIRACRRCGTQFEAQGLVGICEACEMALSAPKRAIVRELGDSWPERHRARLAEMTGPGLERARKILPAVSSDGMIVLAGDRGRGKTQIATWLAWQRGKQGLKPGLYAKTFDLFSDVKASWSKQSSESEDAVMSRYKAAPFLALDEAHERSESDWENRTLRNILDHRYDRQLPTVIIGNWRAIDDISASLGASITDRITETGGVVWCQWSSYRVS